MPKMIKIGEIRVLDYFDLPWNEPCVHVSLVMVSLLYQHYSSFHLSVVVVLIVR